MIIHRNIFRVKRGKMDKALGLCQAEVARFGRDNVTRFYSSNISSGDTLVMDVEFENLAAMDQFWTDWWADPGKDEFFGKFNKATRRGGRSEVWNLH